LQTNTPTKPKGKKTMARLPLSEREYETTNELLQAAWLIVRKSEDGFALFLRLVERLKLYTVLTPTLPRGERRDLTDAEIDLALDQLDAASAIYRGRRANSAAVWNAERKLRQRLSAMRGRVASDDDDADAAWVKAHDFFVTQKLLDLFMESTGKEFCASAADLIAWANSNKGTLAIQAACNRPCAV
jgi:hypothetical protein